MIPPPRLRRAVILHTLVGVLMSVGTAFFANAQSAFPNMVGTWGIISGQVITHEGKVLSLSDMPGGEVIVEAQTGPTFRGIYRWEHPEETVLHDGEDTTNAAEEAFLGVFSANGRTFVLADTPDRGYWFGEFLENGDVVLRYVESGPFAAAGYSVMRRSP
ncbi:MAG: hypothetical protein AAF318_07325 [Pseudomonadota bacterium]